MVGGAGCGKMLMFAYMRVTFCAGVVSRKANEKSKFIQRVPHWI
jgi:hypothetical protein